MITIKNKSEQKNDGRMFFSNLTVKDIGKSAMFYCKVESIYQTSGPTIFNVNDGTGTFSAKAFNKGERAFPNIKEGDYLNLALKIGIYDDNLEGEIQACEKLTGEEAKKVKDKVDSALVEMSKPADTAFLIKSAILEKLRPEMMKAAQEIKKAIFESRPIFIKFHADCDGYSSVTPLEKAILPLIFKKHRTEKKWPYYSRFPSRTPFYDYEDAIRDLSSYLEEAERNGTKMPLILIVDTGSSYESYMAMKTASLLGASLIVVDHHWPGRLDESQNFWPLLSAHVNPHFVTEEYCFSAGMLCTELARIINPEVKDVEHIPAISGTGDRITGEEFDKYLKIAEDKGLKLEHIQKIAYCIDYESMFLRNESSQIINDFFDFRSPRHKEIVDLIYQDIEFRRNEYFKAIKHFANVEEGKIIIATIESQKLSDRGEYPSSGKITGMCHDYMKTKYQKPVVTLGLGASSIVIRADDSVKGFKINEMIEELRKSHDYAVVSGGGHDHAGTIRFCEVTQKEIKEALMKMIKEKFF